VRTLKVYVPEYGGLVILGKVREAVEDRVDEGYSMKYCMGISNLEQV